MPILKGGSISLGKVLETRAGFFLSRPDFILFLLRIMEYLIPTQLQQALASDAKQKSLD